MSGLLGVQTRGKVQAWRCLMNVGSVKVEASPEQDLSKVFGENAWIGGGPESALRAYQAYHPDAAVYMVTFNGRTVWMTSKQRAIWSYAQRYHVRGIRLTMAKIAAKVGCSPATVSRFLRRLDLWRFIDLATLQGRSGGTYIFTRTGKGNEADMNASGARHTMSSRARARAFLAAMVKRAQLAKAEAMLAARRTPPRPWKGYGSQEGIWWPGKVGSTGATFRRRYT